MLSPRNATALSLSRLLEENEAKRGEKKVETEFPFQKLGFNTLTIFFFISPTDSLKACVSVVFCARSPVRQTHLKRDFARLNQSAARKRGHIKERAKCSNERARESALERERERERS